MREGEKGNLVIPTTLGERRGDEPMKREGGGFTFQRAQSSVPFSLPSLPSRVSQMGKSKRVSPSLSRAPLFPTSFFLHFGHGAEASQPTLAMSFKRNIIFVGGRSQGHGGRLMGGISCKTRQDAKDLSMYNFDIYCTVSHKIQICKNIR